MKTREEVARYIEAQFDYESDYECKRYKFDRHHYGKQELRELMDFIYGGEPSSNKECIGKIGWIEYQLED